MSESVEEKIRNYRTAPFDARFPNVNQTRNCYQNYLDSFWLAAMFLPVLTPT